MVKKVAWQTLSKSEQSFVIHSWCKEASKQYRWIPDMVFLTHYPKVIVPLLHKHGLTIWVVDGEILGWQCGEESYVKRLARPFIPPGFLSDTVGAEELSENAHAIL